MKRDKEFNNILDECLEQLLIRGESIEQCLKLYPEQAAELEPLLQTALAASRASAIPPRADFKARARYKFRLALQKATPSRPSLSWFPRWATVGAIVLVLLLVGSGTVAAASTSMPDNPLYPLKLATEQTQLALTPSPIGKAGLCAELVDRRVAEIAYMASKGDARQVELITQRLDERLAMLAVLASAEEEGGAALMAPAPSEAAQVSKGNQAKADKRAKLKMIVESHAVSQQALLQALLDKAPEEAKPALRRAIEVSAAGYKKALEAWH